MDKYNIYGGEPKTVMFNYDGSCFNTDDIKMQSDLHLGAEVTVPKNHDLHATANLQFVKTYNPDTDKTDRML